LFRKEVVVAITREKKEELVALYKELIENSEALVFTDYRGATVPEVQSLRNTLREKNATYMIIKNTLFGIALEQTQRPDLDGLLEGPNAVVFLGEDISTVVKTLEDWIKSEDEIVTIKGGLMASSVLDVEDVQALTDLPTREQALAMLLGTLNAPAEKLVRTLNAPADHLARVLNAPINDLYNVLNARVQQLQE
jgi:large subunit ribosomal protein L10